MGSLMGEEDETSWGAFFFGAKVILCLALALCEAF